MIVFFTLCSKNYTAQAITLYQSFKKKHPDIEFVIGMVDKLTKEEKDELTNYNILEVDEINEPVFFEMQFRYNIIELNTAVKPFYIDYFFKSGYSKVIYLDPDILVYHEMGGIIQSLDNYSFILTPHFTTPIYDDFLLTEQIVLGTGIFNLGFLAIKNDENGKALIGWWQKKLFKECILDLSRGYFVDQKWMNLSICHFNGYLIEKNLGLNVAHWNLHERTISNKKEDYYVNEQWPLIFFHFSSYHPNRPEQIANWQNRYSFESRPDITPLFQDYRNKILLNQFDFWQHLKPVYGKSIETKKPKLKRRIQNKLIHWIQSI